MPTDVGSIIAGTGTHRGATSASGSPVRRTRQPDRRIHGWASGADAGPAGDDYTVRGAESTAPVTAFAPRIRSAHVRLGKTEQEMTHMERVPVSL